MTIGELIAHLSLSNFIHCMSPNDIINKGEFYKKKHWSSVICCSSLTKTHQQITL